MSEPPAHRFVDGSGLSRYNLLNAELLTDLLVYMYQTFELDAGVSGVTADCWR